jgi:uncharacterized membrane protein YdbT with pleckstrin-like domain
MGYVESNLVPGEVLIYQTRLHWIVMLGHIVLACVLAIAGALLIYYARTHSGFSIDTAHIVQYAGAAFIFGAIVALLLGMVRRNATEMAVTNRRVIIKVGLLTRKTIEMLLNKIETIEVRETLIGRLMGYGTIIVIGTGGTPEPFHRLAHPTQFRNQVQQQIEKLSSP